jgi:hypothetical protein
MSHLSLPVTDLTRSVNLLAQDTFRHVSKWNGRPFFFSAQQVDDDQDAGLAPRGAVNAETVTVAQNDHS